jgi:hypothetical protein
MGAQEEALFHVPIEALSRHAQTRSLAVEAVLTSGNADAPGIRPYLDGRSSTAASNCSVPKSAIAELRIGASWSDRPM